MIKITQVTQGFQGLWTEPELNEDQLKMLGLDGPVSSLTICGDYHMEAGVPYVHELYILIEATNTKLPVTGLELDSADVSDELYFFIKAYKQAFREV